MQPQLRLLYWPKNEPTEPDRSEPSEVTILPSQAASTGVPLGISVSTKRDDPLIPGSTQQTHKPPLKFGCLFGHFSANNHECCLTCLHAFYLSKRPKTLYGSRGPKEDAYFLAWHPNPSGHMWFRQRPLGSACLSEILRAISAALYWAAVSPSDLSLFPLNRNSPCGLFDAVNRRARSSFFDVPNVYPEDRSTETEFACAAPLNLVIGECSNAPSNSFDKDVGKAHPTCLDYWPELTERARQSPWQCTDCKVCSVCLNKQLTTELLICDACDKGFHSECHVPKLEEPVDRSLPWVCAECQKEGYSVAIGTMPEGASQQYTIPISKSANNQEESPVKDVGTLSEGSSPDESPHANSQSIAESKARMPTPQMSDVESTTPSNQYHMGIMKPETGNSPAANSLSSPQARTMEKGSPCKPSMNVVSPIDQSIQSTIPASYELSGGRSWDAAKLAPDVVSAPDSPSSITRAVEDKSNGPESFNSVGTLDVPASRESIQCLIRPLDIRAWTVEHVREWLLEEGFPREAEAFFQQEIDGACLLLMKRMDVLTELGIKLGPGVKIYERIKRLQSRCTSPTMLNA
ncbi:unnamed protein product [Dicrocoelium dendriticum]|nr:unnamed protein product [Dicrocoelium dendriticum]